MVLDYDVVPKAEEAMDTLNEMIHHWRGRNTMIKDVRMMSDGTNNINAPKSTQYQVRVGHTYMLASIMNEKSSRFLSVPQLQVVPEDDSPEARTKSSNLEHALNVAFSEMERQGDGDVWSRLVFDAILLDEGVEKIEAAPAAFWPELSIRDEDGKLVHQFEDEDAIKNYKKEHGFPIRTVYVPLENYFPVYEGATNIESFEVEYRSLRSLLNSKLFGPTVRDYTGNTREAATTQVTFICYCSQSHYAYYAILSDRSSRFAPKRNKLLTAPTLNGSAILLHQYEHGLGRSIYNCVAGRFGGWKTEVNRIEGSNKGLIELNQKLDDMYSQGLTNIGAEYWPNLIEKINPMLRGLGNQPPPKPATIKPGEPITMYTDEGLERPFQPTNNPMFTWLWEKTTEQIGRLGGSPVSFGMRQPGVDTGYHQALQISQAEHLDEKLEQHLVQGAINRGTIVLETVRYLEEEMFVHYTEREADNSVHGKWLSIQPEKLHPLPRLDARVRKTRPVDFIASLRAALDASAEREGKGPLLDDDTIREEILGRENPDVTERKILRQTQKNRVINSGIIDRLVTDRIFQKQAQESAMQPGGEELAQADPALLEAIGGVAGNAAQAGGINPDTVAGAAESAIGPGRRNPGMVTTDSQPEARIGEAVAGAANAGLVG